MNRIKLGDYNLLKVSRKVDFGLYLNGGDEGDILLPSQKEKKNAFRRLWLRGETKNYVGFLCIKFWLL